MGFSRRLDNIDAAFNNGRLAKSSVRLQSKSPDLAAGHGRRGPRHAIGLQLFIACLMLKSWLRLQY
jgi:hypothetical protein